MSAALPRGVRVGYGLGSVATGAFGTVPGLLLLPYLTDTLGVAAARGRRARLRCRRRGTCCSTRSPAGSATGTSTPADRGGRSCSAPALALAGCFALLFAGPPLGSTALEAAWVVVLFLACATAYAFFQVPFVAMPAEMTDAYAERTRLMTWRVALLALTILVSGASAPAIRDALGGHARLPRDGRLRGAADPRSARSAAYAGTRRAPIGTVTAGGGHPRASSCGWSRQARDFRLLLTTFVLQALAIGAMLAGVDYVARVCSDRPAASTHPVRLLRRTGAAAHPGVGGGRRADRQEARATSRRRCSSPPARCCWCSRGTVPPAAVYAADRRSSGSATRARRCSRWRCWPTPRPSTRRAPGSNRAGVFTGVWTAGETLGLALGPGLFALVLALGGYVSSTGGDGRAAGLRAAPRSRSASRCCRPR